MIKIFLNIPHLCCAADNFTVWGYQDCQVPKNDGSYGGMLTKLLFRTLPEYYPPGSAYAHFPFMVPEAMKDAMQKRDANAVNDYVWSRPSFQHVLLPPAGNESPAVESDKLYQDRIKKVTGRTFERQSVCSSIIIGVNSWADRYCRSKNSC